MTEVNVHGECIDRWAQPTPGVVATRTHLHLPDNSRFASHRALAAQPATRPAVFLDRDGVVVEDVGFLRSRAQLSVLPGTARALRMLQDHFYIIVVTNQSGIARGLLGEDDLLAIHSELVPHLAAEGALLDALYYCLHLPEATVPAYRLECDCRKPKPGMLFRAEYEWGIDMNTSFMVGDMPRDIEAGCAAGVKGVLLGSGGAARPGAHGPVPDLVQAARLIMAQLNRWMVSYG